MEAYFQAKMSGKADLGANVGIILLIMICRAIALTRSVQCCSQWEMQKLVDNFYVLVSTAGIHFGPQAVPCVLTSIVSLNESGCGKIQPDFPPRKVNFSCWLQSKCDMLAKHLAEFSL